MIFFAPSKRRPRNIVTCIALWNRKTIASEHVPLRKQKKQGVSTLRRLLFYCILKGYFNIGSVLPT